MRSPSPRPAIASPGSTAPRRSSPRRNGGAASAEWPRLVRGDYRELPFEDASFDAVFNLFSSLGYLERDEDVGVLREFRRVSRPGGALVVETAHRDAFARSSQRSSRCAPGTGSRTDSLFLQEREPDWLSGTPSASLHLIVTPDGERSRATISSTASTRSRSGPRCSREAGFAEVEAFGAWDGVAGHAGRLATDPARALIAMD